MSCWRRDDQILGDRRGRRGDGRPHRRSAGDDLAAAAQPQRRRARARPTRASTARRSASTSSARPSSRSPSRWRWTAASSRASARSTIARDELHVYGHVDPRHAPVRPRLLGRRDHEGKLEHRHRADRRPARRRRGRRRSSRRWASSTRSQIELKERGRTLTPGSRWGPFETMTVGFGHGIAVTPLHLATGYATLFNGGIYHPATLLKVDRNHPLRAGPARVHRGHQLQDARAAAAGRDEGHRQEGRRARLSRRRQDRHRGEADRRPL